LMVTLWARNNGLEHILPGLMAAGGGQRFLPAIVARASVQAVLRALAVIENLVSGTTSARNGMSTLVAMIQACAVVGGRLAITLQTMRANFSHAIEDPAMPPDGIRVIQVEELRGRRGMALELQRRNTVEATRYAHRPGGDSVMVADQTEALAALGARIHGKTRKEPAGGAGPVSGAAGALGAGGGAEEATTSGPRGREDRPVD
jgi:hypothetical protein